MTADTPSNPTRRATRRSFLAAAAVAGVGALGVAGTVSSQEAAQSVAVRIENVSSGTTLQTTARGEGSEQPVPLSPGAYAVHTTDGPIFAPGEPERDNGLEEIAEDGSPSRLAETLSGQEGVSDSGTFTTPVDANIAGPILPGRAYEFTVEASEGDSLSFATMFVPSNDLFYAPGPAGIPLADGEPGSEQDVTDQVALWDAGTEINEEPGVGENQVQRQRGPGVGLVERGTVANIEDVNGYEYPAIGDVVQVTLAPE